jgi:hypoxanthine phosphoribosyltransferase
VKEDRDLPVEVLFSKDEIQARVRELARDLEEKFRGTTPLVIAVLKGSVIFLADLLRFMTLDPDIEFMSISSYPGARQRTGVVRILKDVEVPLEGRDVVVIEDIVDTGLSLSFLLRTLHDRGPRTVSVCTLVDKSVQRIIEPQVDYSGFSTDRFVVGYGLDFQGKYRNLPYIGALLDPAGASAEPEALEVLFAREPRRA